MILYDYKCEWKSCGHEFEKLVPSEHKDCIPCPKCNGETKRLMPRTKDDWFRPFTSDDFTGEPIEVRTKEHYRSLCKEHNIYAPHAFGRGFNISEI